MASPRSKKTAARATPARGKRRPLTPRAEPADARDAVDLAVIGVGCSAGGLKALEELLTELDPSIPAALLVVQHLDPDREASLVTLLQRVSPLPVSEIEDGELVMPRRVYVIPRARHVTYEGGRLRLRPRPTSPGARVAIDVLFESLAAELGSRAVVVLLSGMGSDGTAGARLVHQRGGTVLAQAPASAQFDAMAQSAINEHVVDVVGTPAEIATRLSSLATSPAPSRGDATPGAEGAEASAEVLQSVASVLRRATGHDFAHYKPSTLSRRIARRAAAHRLDVPAYAEYLNENPGEAELLFKELLIGVTSFFRDPAAWEQLEQDVIPPLLAAAAREGVLRAWVPACSTGEEAYSLCIVLQEALARRSPRKDVRLQIFATDLDASAIDKARRAHYPESIAREVSPERLARFFVEENGGHRVKKEVRDAVVFAVHNVVQDPPFTKLDFVSCRNLLIYLDPELQRKLLPRLHYALRSGGYLFLGSSETVGGFNELFAPVAGSARLYRRLDAANRPPIVLDALPSIPPVAVAAPSAPIAPGARLQASVEQLLLRRFAPAAVLVNAKGDILYLNGRVDAFLELPAGRANWNLFAMARDGLRRSLGPGMTRALASKKRVSLRKAQVERSGEVQSVHVELEPVGELSALRGCVLVTFDTRDPARAEPRPPAPRRTGGDAARLTLQLQQAKDDLLAVRREMQGSEEDFRAVNEELQSANEELQSANEELTTSKEEMQSMNEELQTLNSELQAKLDELSRAGNDMKNLLDSTEIAILFLDAGLHVRRFTPQVTQLFKLIPGDLGRPLADLASHLDYPSIYDDAREVLRKLASIERRVQAKDGLAYQVRIMPYRTADDRIDGVVITFTSVSPEVDSAVVGSAS